MTRLSLLAILLLAGCDDRIVEETHQPEAARVAQRDWVSASIGAFYRVEYPDGLECVGSTNGGLDCNWPAPTVPSETPEARRMSYAACVNAIDPSSRDLSKLILECGGVRQ